MKALLEAFLRYFDFLYLDPTYRISDSKTDDAGVNAAIIVSGENLTWRIANDRGQLQLSVAPTQLPEQGFWISVLRQYLDQIDDVQYLPAVEEVAWARENIKRIDGLFDPFFLESTCEGLRKLMRSNAEKEWGPAASG
ncbi:hypothetical protein [Mycobacteroides abscessus]|uniref:hypothetical protein n=1 Tax=Mycobacteroides abscessus TaxID=36809 RepID=UPI0005E396FD|nr:hypothetical protein [Mycobacteroides abscessus]CPS10328.1 Uncharacterised protein [Mycobacteroides abscessus]CPS26473.1 Uncharacterised protein [Mycobacteroides abscessus]CPS28997.1 Uncharacterised protein [Mycobacteroides abscessus]CPT09864.1 Uncharacterised protein [Mycobacteroides abscessus]CPT29431.1 Uncharacterised protein [Mycobacteroides abscessus]